MITEKRRLRFRLPNFAELPHFFGTSSDTPSIECFGCKWNLIVYPGGDDLQDRGGPYDEFEGKVSVYLSTYNIFPTKFTMRLLKSDGTVFHTEHCDPKYERDYSTWGSPDVAERTAVIEHCLADGTLTIEVDLQVHIEVDLQVRSNALQLWAPKTRIGSDFARLLESGTGSDVTFVLGKTRIAAHRIILAIRAPTLADWCDDANDNGEVEIAGVDPVTFTSVLTFVYSELFEQPATKAEARSLLELADRFGCASLKLQAEAALAEQAVAVDEAAELLLFADGHGYPQLKELAMDVVLANLQEVMATDGWKKVAESPALLQECLQAAVAGSAAAASNDPKSMRVSDLRRALEMEGGDCDGSRELLEKRLLEPRKRARTS